MEAFSLLKFWKSSTVASAPTLPAVHNDEGPFFDLEFSGSDEEDVAEVVCENVEVLEETETDELVNFRVSSSDGPISDPNLPIEVEEEEEEEEEFKILAVNQDNDDNPGKAEVFPASLLRSATKLRIMMSGLKRSSKPEQPRPDPKQPPQQRKKLFTIIKFKPGEVPIVSLFTRDHSSRPLNAVVSTFSSSSSTSSTSSSSSSSEKPNPEQKQPTPDEKLNPKDKVHKYIKMVKPLYIRVSKKYGERLGLSGQIGLSSKSATPEKEEEAAEKKNQGSLEVGLKVLIKKRLSGKKKSPETAAAAGKHQDDLVQQHEWIQGAILHCKRSLNASRGEESASVLLRSNEKTVEEVTVNDVVGGR